MTRYHLGTHLGGSIELSGYIRKRDTNIWESVNWLLLHMSLVCSFSLPGSNFYKFFNSWIIVMLWLTVDSILVTLELWIIVLITWSINCNVWFYSNCLWRVLSLYQISGFVYFRKPAPVLATANIRHLLSVLGCRDGLIPFRDGERRLI